MRVVLRVADQEDARAARELLAADGHQVVPSGQGAPDLLVVDEWTPENAPWVTEARAGGTQVTVLAELLLERLPGPVVAVTGTAGKTSTCRALEHILRACGTPVAISHTARSGNAWPDHSLASGAPDDAVVIAELTSTHLCHMGNVRADVGVVTMVRPDHVELHGSLERYVAAKRRLVAAMDGKGPLVLPVDDPSTIDALGVPREPEWGFGQGDGRFGAFLVGDAGEVQLRAPAGDAESRIDARGTHARAALAAAAAALALGVPPGAVGACMGAIPAPAHRMAGVRLDRGVTLIDNTMAATPLKALAGIREAPDGPLVLVMGGDDAPGGVSVHASPEEQQALSLALATAAARVAALVCFGPAAHVIGSLATVDATADGVVAALDLAIDMCPDGGTMMVAPMFPMSPDARSAVGNYGR